jgi:hypothetical protein
VLTLAIPGQALRELVGTRMSSTTRRFAMKGLAGFSVEFMLNAQGQPTQAVFYQPNGTFVAPRAKP